MQPKHTPTPWELYNRKNGPDIMSGDHLVCEGGHGGENWEEDAALIVCAVNQRDALVSQLRQHHEDSVDDDHFSRLAAGELGCTTCALIAKAERK